MKNFEEKNTISSRIGIVIDHYDTNIRSFALKIGVTDTVIGNIVRGRKLKDGSYKKGKPSFETIELILDTFPDINIIWLITGEGEMLNSQIVSIADKIKELLLLNEVSLSDFAQIIGLNQEKEHYLRTLLGRLDATKYATKHATSESKAAESGASYSFGAASDRMNQILKEEDENNKDKIIEILETTLEITRNDKRRLHGYLTDMREDINVLKQDNELLIRRLTERTIEADNLKAELSDIKKELELSQSIAAKRGNKPLKTG